MPAPWLIVAVPIALVVALVLGAVAYLAASMRWMARETVRDRYFARSSAERDALRDEMTRRSRRVLPVIRLLSHFRKFEMPVTEHRGFCAPGLACPPKAFEAATRYEPDERDVFVSTQMKCGTTWLQQIVYETLLHGRGNLGDDGHRHMYALSPWIESTASVSMEDAPRVGAREQRIVKTHLPTALCPYSERARFLYVTRHPVACFASCVDFVHMLSGGNGPDRAGLLEWFCSDRMWWGPWPDHVAGWWDWAETRPNVLFLHYEAMLQDLGGAVDRVASFLDVSLTPEERARVVEKSGYDFMKANEPVFEMSPPSFFSVQGGSFLVSGRRERDRDAQAHERDRILSYCRDRLKGRSYPAARFYPELAAPEASGEDAGARASSGAP